MRKIEMNAHQRAIYTIMCHYMSEMIGGMENTMLDYPKGSKEYAEAERYLTMGHEALKQDIYNSVMAQCSNRTDASHARFAGREFLLERIEKKLTSWGY